MMVTIEIIVKVVVWQTISVVIKMTPYFILDTSTHTIIIIIIFIIIDLLHICHLY